MSGPLPVVAPQAHFKLKCFCCFLTKEYIHAIPRPTSELRLSPMSQVQLIEFDQHCQPASEAKVGGGVWHEYILLFKKKKKKK